jgi:hypothetical protein
MFFLKVDTQLCRMMIVAKKKSPLKPFEAHVSNTKKPMGDFYGTGIKQPMGKQRAQSPFAEPPLSRKQSKTPPKALA